MRLSNIPLLLRPLLQNVQVTVEQPLQNGASQQATRQRAHAHANLSNKRYVTWNRGFQFQPRFVVRVGSWKKCEV
jgi:hypothetical protein